jgi:hypothetical protein
VATICCSGVALAAAVAAGPASAAESAWPTAQAVAANAEWIPYLDPPAKPAAVCLVDSGVNITLDTPADSEDGPIVKRLALDGNPGTAANSTWEGLHGTRMALTASALLNDWGTAGFWPGERIISIRAMPTDQTTFPFDNYQRAIALCTKNAASDRLAAVNLSLGCDCAPTAVEQAALVQRIDEAHLNNVSVVASAGNSTSAVGVPANEPGAWAIAAGDATDALCSFSNRGTGVDLVAPGCGLDLADSSSGQPWAGYDGGTSAASMMSSTALALLRSYRPDLDWQAAENLAASSARPSAGGPILDLGALFRASGLSALVDTAKARMPAASIAGSAEPLRGPSSAPEAESVSPPSNDVRGFRPEPPRALGDRYPTPELSSLLRVGRKLTLSVRNRPAGAQLAVRIERRRAEFRFDTAVRARSARDTLQIRLPRNPVGLRLVLRYEHPTQPGRTSPSAYRHLRG